MLKRINVRVFLEEQKKEKIRKNEFQGKKTKGKKLWVVVVMMMIEMKNFSGGGEGVKNLLEKK